MSNIATTKLSSKGQVVIPELIRRKLNLKVGAQFVVVGEEDMVMLKAISSPSADEFNDLISDARKSAKKVGLKKADIKRAINISRGKK